MALTVGPAAPSLAVSKPAVEGSLQRVLQSVSASLGPDGSLIGVEDTRVSSTSGSTDVSTTVTQHDPAVVRDQLPVRILTSYRTNDRVGTNLADLKGYSGRVEIDVTISNLTAAPQNLAYDVGGRSRRRAALVGAPLTVVASASLPATSAGAVVTDPASADAVTNGVLSQSGSGEAQVQWATMLAAPQLAPSTTLRLVVDAKDFAVPNLDISVQPGLVTDPSVTSVMDSAFSPAANQLALESRTVQLVGQVNAVLARASGTISTVRSTLDSSSQTFGVRTVDRLKNNTRSVVDSAKVLDTSLTELQRDLAATLKTNRSSSISQMQQTVTVLDRMLGDTSAKPPVITTSGQRCATTVTAPGASGSVYGGLLQVIGQLDGYAKASAPCKAQVQHDILATVGPVKPGPATCTVSSITCSLFGVQTELLQLSKTLVAQGDKALEALEPQRAKDALTAVQRHREQLKVEFARVNAAAAAVAGATSQTEAKKQLDTVKESLGQARGSLKAIDGAVDTLHGRAVWARTKVSGMSAQNAELSQKLCGLVGAPGTPGKLTQQQVAELRAYIASTPCPGEDPGPTPRPTAAPTTSGTATSSPSGTATPTNSTPQPDPTVRPPAPYPAPMDARLVDQEAAWNDIVGLTSKDNTASGVRPAIASLDGDIGAAEGRLVKTRQALDAGEAELKRRAGELVAATKKAEENLSGSSSDLNKRIEAVVAAQSNAGTAVKKAFEEAGDTARSGATEKLDPEIRHIATQAITDSNQLGTMLDRSGKGLSAAALAIRRDGKATIDRQRAAVKEGQAGFEGRLDDATAKGLNRLTSGVSAADRDSTAASTLLAADLKRILLDIGDRKVKGSGLLGAMSTGAATARSADYQLALATGTATSFANVRGNEIDGLLLRNAQTKASLDANDRFPAFAGGMPTGAQHRTVFAFHLGGA